MAILTTINGIPLFSSVQEALSYALQNKLKGYHTHVHEGKIGYMGGKNHELATNANQFFAQSNQQATPTRQAVPPPTRQPITPVVNDSPLRTRVTNPTQPQPTRVIPTPNLGGSGGGGGGGGGY